MDPIKTTCPYCGVGCGVLAYPDGSVKGDPDHPANYGRLCSKGSALGETVDLEGRLLTPKINKRPASWDQALDLVADKFSAAIRDHGPDSVAFYVSGQLLTEDYYVANKLMKGFIGSANIDTNSRLCMASSVAGHKRAFGTDTVPGTYEDLEEADLIVLVGSNLAWCHPVLYQRIAAAKEKRPSLRIVVVDPRRTATCDLADQHLAIVPGSDVALFNALLSHIAISGAIDPEFFKHVNGLEDAIKIAGQGDASVTGLSPDALDAFCDAFATTEKTVTIYSQGVNQATDGTDKVNAIINCHLATGRIGRPGMGPFSATGQPNAMGGREVGGLANMLACHLDLENADHRTAVQGFWRSPAMPDRAGFKAVDMFEAVADGQIKALWIMSTNPAVSMPEANRVRDAIAACPFTVVTDIVERTDTCDLADVLLPAAGWGEKNGTVTNSDRTISRQRSFTAAPAETRPDWKIICDVAAKMGWADAFDYASPADIFREHAGLSGIAAQLGKDFDISGAAHLSDDAFEAWEPTRWPIAREPTNDRFFADGSFFTPDGRARALSVTQQALPTPDQSYPLRLNTGRVRDHWHTMTRTAKSARLSGHMAEPYVEIHPLDAENFGIEAATLARVASPHGQVILRALITDRTPQGSVFVPIHWTAQWSSDGRVDAAVPANLDPVSGQPALKSGFVAISDYSPAWYGFAVSRHPIKASSGYWATARREQGHSAELAGHGTPPDWAEYAQTLFGIEYEPTASVTDQSGAKASLLFCEDGRLSAALFVSSTPVEVSRSYVVAQLGAPATYALLSGRPPSDQPDAGATVCSCFNVGANTILRAIETHGLADIDAIGAHLQAGTNCGSCRPELRAILTSSAMKVAAQ